MKLLATAQVSSLGRFRTLIGPLLLLELVCGAAGAQGVPCINAAWLQAGGGVKGLPGSLVGNVTISGSGAGFDKYGNEYTVVEYVSRSVRLQNMGLMWSSSDLLPGSMEMMEIRITNKDRYERISTDAPSRVSPGEPTVLLVDFVNCQYSLISDTHVNGVNQIETRQRHDTSRHVVNWGPTEDAGGRSASGFAIQFVKDPALSDPVTNGMKLQGSMSFVAPEVNTDHAGIKVNWTVKWAFEPWSPGAEQRYAAGGLIPPPAASAGSGGKSVAGGQSASSQGGAGASALVHKPECDSEVKGELKGINPDPTFHLLGSEVAFSWKSTIPGISTYALKVGRSVGGHEYFDSLLTPVGAIGKSVPNLPVDGSDVWVRITYGQSGQPRHCADVRYEAALFADSIDRFPVGTGPFDIAFDGQNIWVSNLALNYWSAARPVGSLMKLDRRSGAALQTIPIAGCPGHLAFDGASIWTSTWCPMSTGKASLAAVRVSDGARLHPANGFPVLKSPEGPAFSGTNIFAKFNGGQEYLACMNKNNPNNMQVARLPGLHTDPLDQTGQYPSPIVADGDIIWSVSITRGSRPSESTAIVLGTRTSDCTIVKQFPFGDPFTGWAAYGLAVDAKYVWVGMTIHLPPPWNNNGSDLVRIEKSTGHVQWFTIAAEGIMGMTSDGSHLWVIDDDGAVVAIDPNTGRQLARIPAPKSLVGNVLFDGTYLWVTGMENTGGSVTRIRPHLPLPPPPVKVQ